MTALEAKPTSADQYEGIKNDARRAPCILTFLLLSPNANIPPMLISAAAAAAARRHRQQGEHQEGKRRVRQHDHIAEPLKLNLEQDHTEEPTEDFSTLK